MKKNLLLNLACLCLPFYVLCQKNITLLGKLTFPGKTVAGIWHYTGPGNHEYALVGTSDGLSVVDIQVPTNPVLLFNITANTSLWREVKTYSHYAYVTTEGGGGVTIVDLDSLPIAVNSKTYTGDGPVAGLLDRAHSLQVEGTYLYINGPTGIANGGILICSLADPWNPAYVGEVNLNYVHDCYVRNDTLYASEVFNGQFSVFDITNKATPVLLATQSTPGAFNHNAWLSDNGRYLFTTDELPNKPVGVFDISNLANITLKDLYYTNLNPDAEVHNVRVINDFLVNPSYGDSSYGSQLTICDAARPDNIIETGSYPLAPAKTGLSLSWDASPFLPSGNIIASDVDSGLFILAPVYTRGCYLEGMVTDSLTGAPLNNVQVEILPSTVSDFTSLTGDYKTGLADPGNYQVKFSKTGYITKVISNVNLSNGNLTTLNVNLWNGLAGMDGDPHQHGVFTLSPNPFSEQALLRFPEGLSGSVSSFRIRITDTCGRLIREYGPNGTREQLIEKNGMEQGLYFYSVVSNGQLTGSGKIIVE